MSGRARASIVNFHLVRAASERTSGRARARELPGPIANSSPAIVLPPGRRLFMGTASACQSIRRALASCSKALANRRLYLQPRLRLRLQRPKLFAENRCPTGACFGRAGSPKGSFSRKLSDEELASFSSTFEKESASAVCHSLQWPTTTKTPPIFRRVHLSEPLERARRPAKFALKRPARTQLGRKRRAAARRAR